jgi:multidrug resistance efflux pump
MWIPVRTASDSRRRGSASRPLIAGLVAAGLLTGVVVLGPDLLRATGLIGEESGPAVITHKVQRENLLITVTEDGNLESARNVDVKCEVLGGSTILWLIPDGTQVEKGQEIIRLDASGIEEQLRAQKGIYEKAVAAKIKAEKDASAASIAVQEYIEGTFVKEKQLVASQITVAMENLRSAQNILEHSQRMARKGFATPLQVEADQFAVRRAELDLDAAKTSELVLEKFTRAKMMEELEARRDAAIALAASEQANVELEKSKLDRLAAQFDKCIITAPQSGMAIYYKENSRWGSNSSGIEEGAQVRERQTIVQIPDLAQMQAQVPVFEAFIDQVRPGMRAHLKVLDREFQGVVTSISNQPSSKSFFQAQVKEYPTVVRIEGDATGLRPGLTAEVEILCGEVQNALTVPVTAVLTQAGKQYCWVQTPSGPERRTVVVGLTNNRFYEVKDGVSEGEEVIVNPRAVVTEARESEKTEGPEETDTRSRFGDQPQTPAGTAAPQGPAAGAAPGAGNGGAPAGQRRPPSFSEMDTNKDGKLTKDEVPGRMADFFDNMDADKDGSLTESELAAARRNMQQRAGGAGGAGSPPAGGPM